MMKIKIEWNEYQKMVNVLYNQIKQNGKEYDTIIALPRGGLPLATSLAHKLGIKNIDTYLRPKYFKSKILLVDDISDSGKTLEPYLELNCDIDVACLCYKPQTEIIPKYFAKVYNNDEWIIFPWENEDSKMVRDNE